MRTGGGGGAVERVPGTTGRPSLPQPTPNETPPSTATSSAVACLCVAESVTWLGTVADPRTAGKHVTGGSSPVAHAICAVVLAVLGLGFALGARHALDADHVAAVSTLVARTRGLRASSLAGVAWGLGHTAALLAVALVVVGLDVRLPVHVAPYLELAVAVMLVVLGCDLLRRRAMPPAQPATPSRRPFLIGLVHGLAGSASVMLAVLATIQERWAALGYVVAFGIGSIGGMAAMSAALSVPLGRLPRALGTGAAVASIAIGALLAWDVGHATGWLA